VKRVVLAILIIALPAVGHAQSDDVMAFESSIYECFAANTASTGTTMLIDRVTPPNYLRF